MLTTSPDKINRTDTSIHIVKPIGVGLDMLEDIQNDPLTEKLELAWQGQKTKISR